MLKVHRVQPELAQLAPKVHLVLKVQVAHKEFKVPAAHKVLQEFKVPQGWRVHLARRELEQRVLKALSD